MYDAKILADSISPDDVRITTFEIVFPRFILAEINTHRVFSRNSASSRAIPTEKIIQRVQDEPFIPETFNKRVKGMGIGDSLQGQDSAHARDAWLYARDRSVQAAQILMNLDVDKSRVNRLLEPFMWHTAIITSTEWRNFYALRTDKNAQPEFQIIANEMLELHKNGSPKKLQYGEWHLPLVHEFGEDYDLKRLSAGRCARVSYDRQHDSEPYENTLDRAEKLITSGHMSPTEHQARPISEDDFKNRTEMMVPFSEIDTWHYGFNGGPSDCWSGNLRGWHQFRQELPNQSDYSRTWGEDPYGFC